MGGGSGGIQETPYEQELAKISKQKWGDYQKRFIPFENKWISSATQNPETNVARVEGQTNANMNQAAAKTLLPGKVNPNSGVIPSGVASTKFGASTGQAMATGAQGARNMQVTGEEGVTDLGQGTSTNAQVGYGNLAQGATQTEINDAFSNYQQNAGMQQGVGSALGLAAAYTNPGGVFNNKPSALNPAG
jgi:hypothetical protein